MVMDGEDANSASAVKTLSMARAYRRGLRLSTASQPATQLPYTGACNSNRHSVMNAFHDQAAIQLTSPDGAQATILLQGAQLVSWRPAQSRGVPGPEQLYLSERAVFAPGMAVRGGVPVIFPQFEQHGPLPRHGFARTTPWTVESERSDADHATATLVLRDTEATRAIWPHAFVAELTVSISGTRLDMELAVENTGEAAFEFTCALHTYLKVSDIAYTTIEGLGGVRYLDSLSGQERTQTHDQLRVPPEIDRVYFDVPRHIGLREPGRRVAIESAGFNDAVIWNPGAKKCAALKDMPPEGFQQMCCIEAAQIQHPLRLAPGADWVGRQSLQT